ncbi:MAG: GSCFA domain-containing protein [Cyclobacteriaceae bacterium]
MKEFRTELKVQPSQASIHLKSSALTQGSCFADAIGNRLNTYKIKTLVNPFGVIYNPESIHKVLIYSIFNEPLPENTYLHSREVFLNYNFHSEFSALTKDELMSRLMNTIGSAHYFLKDTDWLLLTYGTAWVYHRKETGEIVANCHKLPSAMFAKSLMTTDAIVSSFKTVYDHLKKFNPQIKIILTVSPVRHLKDTLELNSVSKSILRVACDNISNQYEDAEYFPAYEMMLDDLRDYRFYKQDMLHPTAEAGDYISEKFMERYFSPELKDFVQKWKDILMAMRHKAFHAKTAAHQQFLQDTLAKLDELKKIVNVEEEVAFVKQQLLNRET